MFKLIKKFVMMQTLRQLKKKERKKTVVMGKYTIVALKTIARQSFFKQSFSSMFYVFYFRIIRNMCTSLPRRCRLFFSYSQSHRTVDLFDINNSEIKLSEENKQTKVHGSFKGLTCFQVKLDL